MSLRLQNLPRPFPYIPFTISLSSSSPLCPLPQHICYTQNQNQPNVNSHLIYWISFTRIAYKQCTLLSLHQHNVLHTLQTTTLLHYLAVHSLLHKFFKLIIFILSKFTLNLSTSLHPSSTSISHKSISFLLHLSNQTQTVCIEQFPWILHMNPLREHQKHLWTADGWLMNLDVHLQKATFTP